MAGGGGNQRGGGGVARGSGDWGHRLVVGLVTGRCVDPGNTAQGTEQRRPPGRTVERAGVESVRLGRGDHLVDLTDRLLPVPQDETIHEVGQGFGVECAVSACHHQWVIGGAFGAVDRNAGEVDQIEDVGVDQLGGEIEGEYVEAPGRQVVLEGEQGHTGRSHGRFHVHPRCVGPLRHGVGDVR